MTTASVTAPLPSTRAGRPGALAALSGELGPEDWRRADGAMALALDPQGNGAPVTWDNPQSGMKGGFAPVGGPYLRSDEICRAFTAGFITQTRSHRLQGIACRPSGGDWTVTEAQVWKGA